MKKIISIFFVSVLCFGAHAEPEKFAPEPMTISDFDKIEPEPANPGARIERVPPKPWWRGWEVGVGLPLVTPLTGYNGFIGYANKKSESWWGRRLGARFDFQIPSPIKIQGGLECGGIDPLSGNCSGYDVNASGKILFVNRGFNGLATLDPVTFESDDFVGETAVDLHGVNANFSMKNQNIGGIVDFYPFGNRWFLGGFRMSGGYYVGKMSAELNANLPNFLPNENGVPFNVMGTASSDKMFVRLDRPTKFRGAFNWKYSGPYLGGGFDLGVFRGLKFYFDAGVIYTNAPRLRDGDFTDPVKEKGLQICYSVGGKFCSSTEWANGSVDINNISATMGNVIGGVIAGIAEGTTQIDGFTGTPLQDNLKDALAGYDSVSIGAGVAAWLRDGTPLPWFDELPQDMKDAFGEIEQKLTEEGFFGTGDAMQEKINEALADYYDSRAKAIDDPHDSMKDFKFVPMIKLGVMYRF
jgi:hypothetical protein